MATGGLKGFAKLSEMTSIFQPKTANKRQESDTSPSLIVVCSWMGAATKHIAKYTDGYQRLFPNATIILCQSSVYGMFFGADLAAIQDMIKAASQREDKGSTVLHAFSNGGAVSAVRMAETFAKLSLQISFDSIILDCCPGTAEIASATKAMSFGLPRQFPMQQIGWWMIYLSLLLYIAFFEITGRENGLAWMRRLLNDKTLFAPATRRLYIYSAADELVNSQDVHRHAEDARLQGYATVREVPFESAPHCNLVKGDSARYWDSIRAHVTGDAAYSW